MVKKSLAVFVVLFAIPAMAAWTESAVAPDKNEQSNPVFSVQDDGSVSVIWDEIVFSGTMNQRVYYASGDGAAWASPALLRDVSTDQLPGGVGIAGGKPFAAVDHYTLQNEKTTDYMAREGGAWKLLGTDKGICSSAAVSGRIYKSWIAGGVLYSASSPDAVSWTAAARVAGAEKCPAVFFGKAGTYAAYMDGATLTVSGTNRTPAGVARYVLSFSGFVDDKGELNLLVSHTDGATDYARVGDEISTSAVGSYRTIGGRIAADENGTRHAILFLANGGTAYVWSKNLRNWFLGEEPPMPPGYDHVSFSEKSGVLYLAWTDRRFGNSQAFFSKGAVRTETAANLVTEMYAAEQQVLFGSNVTLYLTVRNAGTEDISENIRVALYTDGNETQSLTISGLGMGAAYSAVVGIPLAREGNVTVRAVADPEGLVRESTKADNSAMVSLEVLKAGCGRDAECAYGQYCLQGKCTECTSCGVAACYDYLQCKKPLPPTPPAATGNSTLMTLILALGGIAAGVLLYIWRRRR